MNYKRVTIKILGNTKLVFGSPVNTIIQRRIKSNKCQDEGKPRKYKLQKATRRNFHRPRKALPLQKERNFEFKSNETVSCRPTCNSTGGSIAKDHSSYNTKSDLRPYESDESIQRQKSSKGNIHTQNKSPAKNYKKSDKEIEKKQKNESLYSDRTGNLKISCVDIEFDKDKRENERLRFKSKDVINQTTCDSSTKKGEFEFEFDTNAASTSSNGENEAISKRKRNGNNDLNGNENGKKKKNDFDVTSIIVQYDSKDDNIKKNSKTQEKEINSDQSLPVEKNETKGFSDPNSLSERKGSLLTDAGLKKENSIEKMNMITLANNRNRNDLISCRSTSKYEVKSHHSRKERPPQNFKSPCNSSKVKQKIFNSPLLYHHLKRGEKEDIELLLLFSNTKNTPNPYRKTIREMSLIHFAYLAGFKSGQDLTLERDFLLDNQRVTESTGWGEGGTEFDQCIHRFDPYQIKNMIPNYAALIREMREISWNAVMANYPKMERAIIRIPLDIKQLAFKLMIGSYSLEASNSIKRDDFNFSDASKTLSTLPLSSKQKHQNFPSNGDTNHSLSELPRDANANFPSLSVPIQSCEDLPSPSSVCNEDPEIIYVPYNSITLEQSPNETPLSRYLTDTFETLNESSMFEISSKSPTVTRTYPQQKASNESQKYSLFDFDLDGKDLLQSLHETFI